MLNKDIPKEKLDLIKLVVFDSDGVSVPRGTQIREVITESSIEINAKTTFITDELTELLKRLRKRFTICISSGRALLYLQSMYNPILGKGTVLQSENGNISLVGGALIQHFEYDEQYFSTLASIKREVRMSLPIEGFEPKQFILSIHADEEIKEVYDIVKKYDKRNELKIMWNGEAFDIQRKEVSKAAGLKKLVEHLGISLEETIAIGDRINDKELLASACVSVSADKDAVPAEYWTEGDAMPGEVLARYLVEKMGL